MWRHYVYIHRRATDLMPFYVGKGSVRKRHKKQNLDRAHDRISRNRHWRNTTNKYGLVVDVLMSCQTDDEAQRQEMKLIAEIGRRDLGTGPLVNWTDGGDGHAGIIVSEELRQKRRKNSAGPRSEAWIASIRKARKNGGNGGVVKHGDKLPESWRKSLSLSKMGEKNPYFGKPTAVAKKVRNVITGQIYDTIASAASAEGINPKTLYQYLDGTRVNRSPLVRA